jgi:hypothetical protein
MTSRRKFLQAGLPGAVFLAVAPRVWLEDHLSGREPLYKIIFDERFPVSVAFATRELGPSGTSIQGIRGDVTALWYRDLYYRWKNSSARIAGVTTRESLFCLEMLARDAGLSVTTRQSIDDELVLWSIGPRPSTPY